MSLVELSTACYIGVFVILIISIICLVIISPTQTSFYDLKYIYPTLYYILHTTNMESVYKKIINEIVNETKIIRTDIDSNQLVDIFSQSEPIDSININQSNKLEWLSYSADKYEYVRGNVSILPLFYNGKYYSNNINRFNLLMSILYIMPNIINVFFWRLPPKSGLLEHTPKTSKGIPNIDEANILDIENIYRYTLAINVLSCSEEDCSIWVNGHIRTLLYDKYIVWTPNKPFSIHNDSATEGDTLFLNIDFTK